MKPMERRAMATTPANTPGPKMATSSKAQIKELIERDATIASKAKGLIQAVLGVAFRAARKAIGTAMSVPSKVPNVAIFNVSHSGPSSSRVSRQSGGGDRKSGVEGRSVSERV